MSAYGITEDATYVIAEDTNILDFRIILQLGDMEYRILVEETVSR